MLAVVSRDGTHRAVEVLDFLWDLGCRWVGFNIEAKEGANALGDTPALEDARRFWRDTFAWCQQNRDVTVGKSNGCSGSSAWSRRCAPPTPSMT